MSRRRPDRYWFESGAGVASRREDAVPFGHVRVWRAPSDLVNAFMSTDTWSVIVADALAGDDYYTRVLAVADSATVVMGGPHWDRALARWSGQLPSQLDDAFTAGELTEALDDL
jgi:hypothetical protein